jgi:ribonuclease G
VDIVEPHMYDVDAAVAKIDGYIISVLKGGSHVGERRLVRIDEVGRTGATARLVGESAGSGEAEEPGDAGEAGEPGGGAGNGGPEAGGNGGPEAGGDGGSGGEGAGAGDDDVESKPRRRGRRGGRRRSRAKAGTES